MGPGPGRLGRCGPTPSGGRRVCDGKGLPKYPRKELPEQDKRQNQGMEAGLLIAACS